MLCREEEVWRPVLRVCPMPATPAKKNVETPGTNRLKPVLRLQLHFRFHEREQRKIVPIQRETQIEHLGETGAGGERLVPLAVRALRFEQVCDAALQRRGPAVTAG